MERPLNCRVSPSQHCCGVLLIEDGLPRPAEPTRLPGFVPVGAGFDSGGNKHRIWLPIFTAPVERKPSSLQHESPGVSGASCPALLRSLPAGRCMPAASVHAMAPQLLRLEPEAIITSPKTHGTARRQPSASQRGVRGQRGGQRRPGQLPSARAAAKMRGRWA